MHCSRPPSPWLWQRSWAIHWRAVGRTGLACSRRIACWKRPACIGGTTTAGQGGPPGRVGRTPPMCRSALCSLLGFPEQRSKKQRSVAPGTPRRATWTCSTEAEIRRHCASGAPIKINSGDYRRISLAVSASTNARRRWCNPFSDKQIEHMMCDRSFPPVGPIPPWGRHGAMNCHGQPR